MKKPKIVIDDNIPFVEGRLEDVAETIYVDQWGFTPEIVKDADALLIRTRTRCDEALLAGSTVRMIATATIGMDQIDTEWCRKAGIKVANAPGCNAPGVAQYVWSALLRKGFDPSRHTLGIVGVGNVGGIVAEWGERLGAETLLNDPPREEAGMPGRWLPLEEVLRRSDAVTLHTPLTKEGVHPSHHLIGAREIGMMKRGAILVNAARGPVVDAEALEEALREGRIRAVVDTWEHEPEVERGILDRAEYATFHIAGYSRQGKERATRMALEALGRELSIPVDLSGLEGPYAPPAALTVESIMKSYDPAEDTAPLRNAPEEFDTLRRNYRYREETR